MNNGGLSRVTDVSLAELLPASIANDENILVVCDAMDQQLVDIAEDVEVYLPFLPNLDNIPERIIDLLAWQYHVDDYDPNADIVVKRTRIRQAIADHRIQGTPRAVKNVLDAAFGEVSYILSEWFDHGGEPYTFRIVAITDIPLTQEFVNRLHDALAPAKNVRSWYDLMIGRQESEAFSMYIGLSSNRMIKRRCVAA